MGALRENMIAEMKLRNFAARTQKSYLAAMVGLAKHYRQYPDQLTQEQIRSAAIREKLSAPTSTVIHRPFFLQSGAMPSRAASSYNLHSRSCTAAPRFSPTRFIPPSLLPR
jgi:Phage integrase, N-terminal SAM-like domain